MREIIEMDMIRKIIEIEIDKKDISDSEHSITAVVSTEDVDRDNEVIKLDGMNLENYRKSGMPLLFQHRPEWLLGKGLWIVVRDQKLIGKWRFHMKNDLSRETYELIKDGYIKQFSIGFISKGKTKSGVHFSSELLETSIVNIASNVFTEVLETKVHNPILRKELQLNPESPSPFPFDVDKFASAIKQALDPDSLKKIAHEGVQIELERIKSNINDDPMVEVDMNLVKKLVDKNILEMAMKENPEMAKKIISKRIERIKEIELGRLTGKVF